MNLSQRPNDLSTFILYLIPLKARVARWQKFWKLSSIFGNFLESFQEVIDNITAVCT